MYFKNQTKKVVSPTYLLNKEHFELDPWLQCLEVTAGLWYQSLVNSDIYDIDFDVDKSVLPTGCSWCQWCKHTWKNLLSSSLYSRLWAEFSGRPEHKFPDTAKRSHFPLWLESSLVMQGLPLLHAVMELRLSTLLSWSVEWVPSDPKLSLPARSCDTIRASRSPSSISVCCMRWRLQLAGLEVSVGGRGDGDWLHCEPMSCDTLSRLSVDKLSSSALWIKPSEPSTPRSDDTLSGTITSCLALFWDRTLFSSAFDLACFSVEV